MLLLMFPLNPHSMGGNLASPGSDCKAATPCSGPPHPATSLDSASWPDTVPLKPWGLGQLSSCLFQTWPAGLPEGPQGCMPWPIQSCLPQLWLAILSGYPCHCMGPPKLQPGCQSYLAHTVYTQVTLTQVYFIKIEVAVLFHS